MFVPALAGGLQIAGAALHQGYVQAELKRQARLAAADAQAADEAANAQADQVLRQGHLSLGAEAARMAEGGTGPGGSNADIARQSGEAVQLNAADALYRGELAATGDANRAASLRAQASQGLAEDWLGAGAKLLSGTGGYLSGGRRAMVRIGG